MGDAMDAAKLEDSIQLGGTMFSIIEFDRRTVIADHYLMKLTRQCGIDKAMLAYDGESNQEYMLRIQAAVMDSGRAHELIAGVLVPHGKTAADWTPAIAVETAKFIGALDTQEDRDKVTEMALRIGFAYFRQGLERLNAFLNSLAVSARKAASPSK